MIDLKNEDYFELIKKDIVIVDFYATWCGPCKMMKLVLDEIDKERDIKIIEVDVDKHDELAKSYGVMSIPTLLFYKDGELISKNIGFIDKTSIYKIIEEL